MPQNLRAEPRTYATGRLSSNQCWLAARLPAMELIQQRLVTNIKALGGLLAVPVHLVQSTENQLFLSTFGCTRRLLFKGTTGTLGRVRSEASLAEFKKCHSYVGQDQEPLDIIFELADVSRPRMPGEGRQNLRRQLLDSAFVLCPVLLDKNV